MLTPRLRGLLERIASSHLAVIVLEEVPDTLGLPAEDTSDAVGELIAEGYATVWKHATCGRSLTLTALSAAIRGVDIGRDRRRNVSVLSRKSCGAW